MPAVQPGAKILVTGANGFIAAWLVKYLLEKGYSVRGTVRSEAKGVHLKEQFSSYGDKLELFTVPDITETGAFDQAVQGVDAVLHTASPFHLTAVDPSELIDPALKGTTRIMESALKHSGPQLKRVVLLSSITAVSDGHETGILDESNWNIGSPKEVEELGRQADPSAMYRASKTLAERAAWAFVEQHKTEIKWDLVAICPALVFGPIIHEISSPESLGTSTGLFYHVIARGVSPPEVLLLMSWVDVRDLAKAHLSSLELEQAGGERFIICSGPVIFQKFVDAWNDLIAGNPSLVEASDGSKLGPGEEIPVKRMHEFNNAKSREVLRMTYRDEKITLVDSVMDYEAKRWM